MWLIVAIIALPLIEIGLFVTLGGALGLWLTLIWVVLAAGLGIIVLKGVAMMGPISLSRNMQEFGNPLSPLAHRLLLVVAGGFLLVPGFFTDFVALLLLIPPVRQVAINMIGRRFKVAQSPASFHVDLSDAEYREVNGADGRKDGQAPSQWTQH